MFAVDEFFCVFVLTCVRRGFRFERPHVVVQRRVKTCFDLCVVCFFLDDSVLLMSAS